MKHTRAEEYLFDMGTITENGHSNDFPQSTTATDHQH